MKKIKKILIGILISTLIFGTVSNATTNTNVVIEDYDPPMEDTVNLKTVQINYDIADEFKSFDIGTLILKNKETLQTTSHTLTKMFANNSGAIFLVPGNYEFVAFTFSRKNGTAINYEASLSPKEFTVDDNGIVGENPTLNVILMITNPQKQLSRTLINDGKFKGYIGVSYYTISDALDAKNKSNYIKTVTHSSAYGGEINNYLYAGQSRITNVQAFDKNKKPLNVYVSPYFFFTRRTLEPDKFEDEPQYIYAFHNLDELTKEQISKIESEGYILFSADSMDDYAPFPNDMVTLNDTGLLSSQFDTVFANDIPSPEPGWQLYTKGPSGKEVALRYGFSGDEKITETPSESEFNPAWLLLILIIPGIFGFFYLKKKNDERENKDNEKNKKKKEASKEKDNKEG